MTFSATLVRVGFPVALLCALSGCLGPYTVGYGNGTETDKPESLAVRPATAIGASQELFVQKITKTGRLLLSPDGGRDKIPLSWGYRYYLKIGAGPDRELEFLRIADTHGPEREFAMAFALIGTDRWIGIRQAKQDFGFAYDKAFVSGSGQEHQFPVCNYPVILFSPQGILQRYEIETVAGAPQFQMQPDSAAIRFWRNDGWCLFDVATGQVHPEPNRPREALPDHQAVTLPGTTWKVVMDSPPFEERQESFNVGGYEFEGSTRRSKAAAPPYAYLKETDKSGLSVSISISNELPATMTREEYLSLHFNRSIPPELRRTAQYDRTEWISPGTRLSDRTLPDTKTIKYLALFQGRSAEITLIIFAPFERWEQTIARFDAGLRFENATP